MKKLVIILILFSMFYIFGKERESSHKTKAEFVFAYYFGHHAGYGQDTVFLPIEYGLVSGLPHHENDPGTDLGREWRDIEFKFALNHSIKIPFLSSGHPLFEGNNLKFDISCDFSPLHIKGIVKAAFTPIAILNLSTGSSLGTGWEFLGMSSLGKNIPGKQYDGPEHEPFEGVVYKTFFKARLQFDIAAIFPGKWNHIVMFAESKFYYQKYSNADDNTAWQWEKDEGENFNGWMFNSKYFLGYQMPLKVNLIGFMLETGQHLSHRHRSPMKKSDGSNGWGSDFIKMRFGPLTNLQISKNSDLKFIIQFERGVDYSDETVGNRYFEYREYEGSYISLDRAVFVYEYMF